MLFFDQDLLHAEFVVCVEEIEDIAAVCRMFRGRGGADRLAVQSHHAKFELLH